MPDIDIDFCYQRRGEVIDYVIEKYGADHVAQIVTFGTMAAKGAIRDVARAMNFPYAEADALAKLVPNALHITLDSALKISPPLRTQYEENETVRALIDTARSLEGMPRHASTHAAGVVITRRPVDHYVPLAKNDEAIVTQYPMNTLEELGLLKMDFLGLRNLTVLDDAIKMLQESKPGFSLDSIPDHDAETLQMLSAGQTSGVFQMESAGMTGVCVGLKPKDLEDITAIIALYRPGPMESIPRFIASKQNPKLITYQHPSLEPILSVTYGCIVYQEQVIEIFRKLAGFSLGQADMVRRAISKKQAEQIKKERSAFVHGDAGRGIHGCIANGIPEPIAEAIYDEIFDFANYAFNKAHAVAYAVIAYQTAWFKCHHPREYMAALLTSVLDHQEKISEYIAACRAGGIALLPPDINKSGPDFSVSGADIRFGLAALKGVGRGFTQALLKERETNGPFLSFPDFCTRMLDFDLNKRVLESLIRSGAFDSLGIFRSQLLDSYEQLVDGLSRNRKKNLDGQMDLFGAQDTQATALSLQLRNLPEFSPREKMAMEKEVTGLYLSGHPMDEYRSLVQRYGAIPIGAILSDFSQEEGPKIYRDNQEATLAGIISSVKTKSTRNDSLMAYVSLEDDSGSMELLAFSRTLDAAGSYMKAGQAVLVQGRLSSREDKPPQLICNKLQPLEHLPATAAPPQREAVRAGTLYLKLPSEQSAVFEKIKKIFIMFPGESQAVFYFSDSGRRLGTRCVLHPALIQELKDLLGEACVVLK